MNSYSITRIYTIEVLHLQGVKRAVTYYMPHAEGRGRPSNSKSVEQAVNFAMRLHSRVSLIILL